jgi:hypothetical protein
MTGRIPVVHWEEQPVQHRSEKDAFSTFFEPVSPLTIDDLIGGGRDFFPQIREHNLRGEESTRLPAHGRGSPSSTSTDPSVSRSRMSTREL